MTVRPTPVNPVLFVLLVGLLQTMAPVSVDLYLPALPTIAAALGARQADVQLTLSAFLIGFGLGQLVWGPLGDRYGRRRPMIAGLLLYLAGSVGCALVDDIHAMILLRLVQALGGCAVTALGQAMVRDSYEPVEGARIMSLMSLVTGVAPLAAPLVGGGILLWFGWRAIFWVLTGFGVLALLGVLIMPETLPATRRVQRRRRDMVLGYGTLLGDRRYLGYALSGGLVMAGMFAYISGTPFVYIEYFRVPTQLYGLLFGVNVVGMMLVGMLNSRLVTRVGPDRLLRLACAIAAGAGALLTLSGAGGLALIALLIFAFVSMVGMVGPNAASGAMADRPEMAGAAAALMGSLSNGIGALTGAAVGWLADGTPAPMTLVMGLCGVAALLANLLLLGPVRR